MKKWFFCWLLDWHDWKPERNAVWIVEMWNDALKQWEPTVSVSLCQLDGRQERTHWQRKNPYDRFRVVRYLATR